MLLFPNVGVKIIQVGIPSLEMLDRHWKATTSVFCLFPFSFKPLCVEEGIETHKYINNSDSLLFFDKKNDSASPPCSESGAGSLTSETVILCHGVDFYFLGNIFVSQNIHRKVVGFHLSDLFHKERQVDKEESSGEKSWEKEKKKQNSSLRFCFLNGRGNCRSWLNANIFEGSYFWIAV